MKFGSVAMLVVAGLALTDTPLLAQPRGPRGGEQAGRFGWLSSLEEGKSLARQNGKPLMVVVRCVP